MKKLDKKQVQQCLFEMLCCFADYCDCHNLRYYLCGGTLLGAVRHKDFIPWDEDIDILMPRPDYIRLHDCVKKEPLSDNYEIRSPILCNSPFPFGKIVNIDTKVLTKFNNTDTLLWMDIFPMDGLPNDIGECNKHLKKAKNYRSLYGFAAANPGSGTTVLKMLLKIPIVGIAHLIGYTYFSDKLDEMARKYDFDQSEYVGGISWGNGVCERMKKSEFIPYVEMEFHGRKFHAPFCWDYYLKALYGDYMKLPPENKRYAHLMDVYIV